jgi:hypothetical protein
MNRGPHQLIEPPLLHIDAGRRAHNRAHGDAVCLQPLHHFAGRMKLVGKGHNAAADAPQVPHRHTLHFGQPLPQQGGQILHPALDPLQA